MRHELLLIAAALLVLIAEIFWNPDKKKKYKSFFNNPFWNHNYSWIYSFSDRLSLWRNVCFFRDHISYEEYP